MSNEAKEANRAVLFVLIGWARKYDGTEPITGNHRYLKDHPEDNSEASAFAARDDGFYYCGAGRGEIREPAFDVVFLALNEQSDRYEIVGLYQDAKVLPGDQWKTVRAKSARLISSGQRPVVNAWPTGQGMRRWALRVDVGGREYPELYKLYSALKKASVQASEPEDDLDLELSAFEGKKKKLFVIHRTREAKLRVAKIRSALQASGGKLKCEVPRCGFDFFERYGEIGQRFAVVHHLIPLSSVGKAGATTTLKDLAIVCANCHAMIHRGGECRELDALIPE